MTPDDNTYYIFILLIPLILVFFPVLVWYLRFRQTKRRTLVGQKASPNIIASYRARNQNDLYRGELYIAKDRVWFEKSGKNIFEIAPREIAKIIYNSRSIKIVLSNRQSHIVRHLQDSAPKNGFLGYWAAYDIVYNAPETLKNFLHTMRKLELTVEEGPTGKEPAYFYLLIFSVVIGISLLLIMLIT